MTTFLKGISLHPKQAEVFNSPHRFKCVVAGRRWGKCLSGETSISLSDGTSKLIKDIRVGDLLPTINENTYKIQAKPVLGIKSNGIRETVRVKTSYRELVCTPNHPLLINNRWVEAKDINIGDLAAVPKALPTFGNIEMANYEIDLLSIWLAEGRGNGFTNGTVEVVETFIDAVAGFGCSVRKRGKYDYYWVGERLNEQSTAPTLFLKQLGLWGRNSKTKFIPDCVYRLPKHQLARFLNLFFATDGCITRRCKNTWSIEIGLANERMLRQLAELLLKFGIRGQIRKKVHAAKSNKTGENFVSWRFIASDAKSLIIFSEEIGALGKETAVAEAYRAAKESAGNCNSYLPISYDNFIKHLNYSPVDKGKYGGYNRAVARDLPEELRSALNSWRKQTVSRVSTRRFENIRTYSNGYFDNLVDGDLAWEEIISVEFSGSEETFDLEIQDNHNFFAEGFCTHNSELAAAEMIRACRKPRQLIWYVAPTYKMAKQIMWVMLKDKLPSSWLKKRPNETALEIHFINDTILCLKGADKPDSLRGVGVNFLVLDEVQDMREEVWKTILRPTLSDKQGKALFVGTPKAYNHLYNMFENGQKTVLQKRRLWKSWQFPTITSPFIPKWEIEEARSDMDERSFRQEFEATFETMSGRVYYNFQRKTHVGDYKFNPHLPIWSAQDFNVDPMSTVILQQQENGEVWAVDEIYFQNSNTAEVCDELERRYWRQLKSITIYPDPAGANRSTRGRGESDLDIFRDRGFLRIKYRRKHPPIADRINAVNRMLKSADGIIRLKIDQKCTHLIKSLEQTLYKKGSPEIDKTLDMEHMSDALGYAIEFEFPRRKFEAMGINI